MRDLALVLTGADARVCLQVEEIDANEQARVAREETPRLDARESEAT